MVMSEYLARDGSNFVVYPPLLSMVNNYRAPTLTFPVLTAQISLITKGYKGNCVGYVYKPFVPEFIDQD